MGKRCGRLRVAETGCVVTDSVTDAQRRWGKREIGEHLRCCPRAHRPLASAAIMLGAGPGTPSLGRTREIVGPAPMRLRVAATQHASTD